MISKLRLKLYGYTVRGVNPNDNNSPFEDHIVVTNYNTFFGLSTKPLSEQLVDFIQNHYNYCGLETDKQNIIPDFEDDRISVTLDLNQLYWEQIKEITKQREKEKRK